jgi:hypothetical protein
MSEHHTSETGSGYWQTPVADDAVNRKAGKFNSRGEPKLSAQVLLPTPTATNYGTNQGGSAGRTGKVRPSLQTMAKKNLWPTPTRSDGTGGPGRGNDRQGGDNLRTKISGKLNPTWVEWLMNWPINWTSLELLQKIRWESLSVEPTDIPRIVDSRAVPNRVDRLKALGNGQVPACAAEAWEVLH